MIQDTLQAFRGEAGEGNEQFVRCDSLELRL
jgi:hypothetical protein